MERRLFRTGRSDTTPCSTELRQDPRLGSALSFQPAFLGQLVLRALLAWRELLVLRVSQEQLDKLDLPELLAFLVLRVSQELPGLRASRGRLALQVLPVLSVLRALLASQELPGLRAFPVRRALQVQLEHRGQPALRVRSVPRVQQVQLYRRIRALPSPLTGTEPRGSVFQLTS